MSRRLASRSARWIEIDAEHTQAAIDQATWDKLFADVTPEELATKGQSFPIGPYFDDILEAYEKNVEN